MPSIEICLELGKRSTVVRAKRGPRGSFLPAMNVRFAVPRYLGFSFTVAEQAETVHVWKGLQCSYGPQAFSGTHCPVGWLPDGDPCAKRPRDQHRFKFDSLEFLGP